MSNICLVNLVGIPAAGKTTFCQKILQFAKLEQFPYNVLHLSYDDFIQIPITENEEHFNAKLYRKQRCQLAWTIQRIVKNIQEKNGLENVDEILNIEFSKSSFDIQKCLTKSHSIQDQYVLLIDDNMYYKSMRKQIRNIAIGNRIGYLIVNFTISLEAALERNENRVQMISHEFIKKMYQKFEVPDNSNELIINFTDKMIEMDFLPTFADAIVNRMKNPLRQTEKDQCVDQSIVHNIDIQLRKAINSAIKSMDSMDSVDRASLAQILCEKRKFLLTELRCGNIDETDFTDLHALLMCGTNYNRFLINCYAGNT